MLWSSHYDSLSQLRDPDINLDINLDIVFCFYTNFQQLLILFILWNYCLFDNTKRSKLLTDQPAVKVIAVIEKKDMFFSKGYKPIQSSMM